MRTVAKRRFGQHFLRDTGVLDRIVRLIKPMPEDVFVEIGAGDGALSARLAGAVSRLIAVEVDVDLLQPLEAKLSRFPTALVIQGDILKMNLAELVGEHLRPAGRLRIAGNLPYNIATAIIRKLLYSSLPIADMAFLLQLEVAHRIAASPGSREFGLLSLLTQHLSQVSIAFKVSPACFVPRPKVTSALVFLRPLFGSLDPCFEACFRELGQAAFGYRRKTIINALRRHAKLGADAARLLAEGGIDGSRRPEDLSVQEYEQLARVRLRIEE